MTIKITPMMKPKTTRTVRRSVRCSPVTATLLCLTSLIVAGCGESIDPRLKQLRDRFISAEPIAGETSVSNVLKQLNSDDAPETVPVVLRGQISAGDLPPWETGKAAFALTDTTGHDGDTDHDPHTCPFCSRSIQDYMANIFFRDGDGQVLNIDSRELFDVQEKQTVVINGQAKLGPDDTLEIDAKQMYVRRP